MTLAVGFFDGVHLGHRAILSGADAALTFRNHPLSVLAPGRAPKLLMSAEDRIAAMRACGVRRVVALDFTSGMASMEAEDFAARLEAFAGGPVDSIRCGANWRFGRGARGDAALLRRLGIGATVVPYATSEGEVVSSTRIRAAVAEGDMERAAAMSGRPFARSGAVVAGKGLGRGIGFPTVNLKVDLGEEGMRLVAPPRGVYAVESLGARGVANWGVAPTMGERAWREATLEIHFLGDFPPVAAGDHVTVAFRRFIRPERRFGSLDELKAQIARDRDKASRDSAAAQSER